MQASDARARTHCALRVAWLRHLSRLRLRESRRLAGSLRAGVGVGDDVERDGDDLATQIVHLSALSGCRRSGVARDNGSTLWYGVVTRDAHNRMPAATLVQVRRQPCD